jgi:hypothetical protein
MNRIRSENNILLQFFNVHDKLLCFVPGRPFQPNVTFASKGRSRVKLLSGAPLLALPTNTRPGWKGLSGKNRTVVSYSCKSIKTLGPCVIDLVRHSAYWMSVVMLK